MRSYVERLVSYGLAAAAVVGLLYFLGSIDKGQKESVSVKEAEHTRALEDVQKAETELADRKKQVEQIRQDIAKHSKEVRERFESLLPASKDYVVFIEQVQRKAAGLGVTITTSQYSPPRPSSGGPSSYLEFKYNLSVIGMYERMKQFLWEVENDMGVLVTISNMNLKPPIVDPDGNMSISMTLSTFFKP